MKFAEKEEVFSQIYLKLLNFLSFSKRSRKEVLDKVEKYVSKSSISPKDKSEIKERIILALEKDGYLRDATDVDFAKSYIESLENSGKSFNSLRINRFLQKKGVSRDIINDILKNLDKDLIYESVLRDAQKKLRTLGGEDKYTKKRKLLKYLYGKGYPFDISSSVVDTLL